MGQLHTEKRCLWANDLTCTLANLAISPDTVFVAPASCTISRVDVECSLINIEINLNAPVYTGCFFRLVPPPKVLSVEDGKIPTKKVKVRVKTSNLTVG